MNEINKERTTDIATDTGGLGDLGPSKGSIKGRYKDDNLRRAQELTSMFPIGEQFENFDYQALQSLQSEQSEWREAERRQYDMWLARKNKDGHVDSRFDSRSSYSFRKFARVARVGQSAQNFLRKKKLKFYPVSCLSALSVPH